MKLLYCPQPGLAHFRDVGTRRASIRRAHSLDWLLNADNHHWALTVLERVLRKLRIEYRTLGREALLDKLKSLPTGGTETTYAKLATDIGMTDGAVKVAAHRLRRRFRAALVPEVAETVLRPEQVDGEIRFLFEAAPRVSASR